MSNIPKIKIFDAHNNYIGCVKTARIDAAAVLVSHLGSGSTLRYDGHRKNQAFWTEGKEEVSASQSFDAVQEALESYLAEAFKWAAV